MFGRSFVQFLRKWRPGSKINKTQRLRKKLNFNSRHGRRWIVHGKQRQFLDRAQFGEMSCKLFGLQFLLEPQSSLACQPPAQGVFVTLHWVKIAFWVDSDYELPAADDTEPSETCFQVHEVFHLPVWENFSPAVVSSMFNEKKYLLNVETSYTESKVRCKKNNVI